MPICLELWEGRFFFYAFDFSFWNDLLQFFLLDYEIKQDQPQMNHFDQSERQFFENFPLPRIWKCHISFQYEQKPDSELSKSFAK